MAGKQTLLKRRNKRREKERGEVKGPLLLRAASTRRERRRGFFGGESERRQKSGKRNKATEDHQAGKRGNWEKALGGKTWSDRFHSRI